MHQHAMNAEHDTVLANLSVCLSHCGAVCHASNVCIIKLFLPFGSDMNLQHYHPYKIPRGTLSVRC